MAAPPKPIILVPNNGVDFSTNIDTQTLSGTTSSSTFEIRVNGDSSGVVYTPGETVWSAPNILLSQGPNTFNVTALNAIGEESPPETMTISLMDDTDLTLTISSPTGIYTESQKDAVTCWWVQNPEPQVTGYNVYGSTEAGGGAIGYTQLNTTPISTPASISEELITLNEEVETTGSIRKTILTQEVRALVYFSFTQLLDPVTGEPIQQNIRRYYVITAVGFDPTLSEEVESVFSDEINGLPQFIDTSLKDLTPRTEYDVSLAQIERIQSIDDEIDLKPGTVTRDVFIDPPSAEFARLYVVLDFVHRAQSFLTLLAFDDSDDDGISDPVDESPQKQALRDALFLDDGDTQQLIDEAFTKLAGNFNVIRKGATQSRGVLTVYTLSSTAPTNDIVVNQGALFSTTADPETGTPAFLYEALSEARIRISSLSLYWNASENRYEVNVDVRAQVAGADANVAANKISNVVSGVSQPVGVTNNQSLLFGTDQESNVSLATRGVLAFISVDTGTKGGYLAKSLAVPNVLRARVIDAGNEYMERDWDDLRQMHIGGKVDVYIQGEILTEISARIAFVYPHIIDEPATIQNVLMFAFEVTNPSVTVDTPILSVSKVRNLSRLADYDLTGYTIVDGTIIDLDETNPANLAIGLDSLDTIEVTYIYQPKVEYIPPNQPVIEITDVTGEVSGDLNNNYNFYKEQDPLWYGDSTLAQDRVELFFYAGKPTSTIQSTTEDIILEGEERVDLSKVGVYEETIIVKDQAGSTTFLLDQDYKIVAGDFETATQIYRLANGAISSGELVKVSYDHAENVIVKYTHNTLLDEVQQDLEEMRHATADVLVKQAAKAGIALEATAVIDPAGDRDGIDSAIRTRLTRYAAGASVGSPAFQGDVIAIIENTSGVIHTVLNPSLAKMVRADNTRVFREVVTPTWQFFYLDVVNVYITTATVLAFKTIDGGGRKEQIGTGPGFIYRHVRIYENNEELTMVDSEGEVGRAAGQGFIKGDGRLVVSTTDGADPSTHSYQVTYYVYGETGAYDIFPADFEYLELDVLEIVLTTVESGS